MKKSGRSINGLINYLAAVSLALVFALFLSGRVGWFLVLAFICAPVISLLLTLMFKSRIYISVDSSTCALCKDELCEMTVTVSNGFFLPSPPLRVRAADDPRASCSIKDFSVSVMPFSEESFEIKYIARICGVCNVGIDQLRITDFFGLFSFKLKGIDEAGLKKKLCVIPDIARVSINDETVRQAMELSARADDSEDTADSGINTFGGFPGYDSRDYVPGDPLKRINWKQSAKRGRLLVRLDDETACSSVSVVLDGVFDTDKINIANLMCNEKFSLCTEREAVCMAEQFAVEQALGTARLFLLHNYSVDFYAKGSVGWNVYTASDENDLTAIRTDLSSFEFSVSSDSPRFPAEELSQGRGTVSVFCTPYFDAALKNELADYLGESSKGNLKTVVMYAACEKGFSPRGGDDQ